MARASLRWSLAMGVVSASWLVNAPAHAVGLVPLSQERSVQASTRYRDTLNLYCDEPGEPPCTDSASAQASAPDFGAFDVTVAPTCLYLSCPPVSASQTSTIGPMGITLDMRAYAEADYGHEGTQSGSSIATSSLSVQFSIDQRIDFEILLFSDIRSTSWGTTFVDWTFHGPGISVDCPVDPQCGDSWSLQGTLEPGDYDLRAGVQGNAWLADYPTRFPAYEEGIVSLDLRLIPEPGTGLLLLVGISGIALASRRCA